MAAFFKINCIVVFFLGALYACTPAENKSFEIPEYIRGINNVAIFSPEEFAAPDTARLIREQVFGDTENVYISGVREFIADESGRVYIADVAPGLLTIHVYSPDGSYITSLGRQGEGPGEFNSICCMRIRSNRLFVFDKALARLTVYSTDSRDLQETIHVDRDQMDGAGQISGKRFWNYYFLDDETLLLVFRRPQMYFENEPGSIHYFTADTAFQQLGEEVLEQEQIMESWGTYQGMRIMQYFPFFHKPLFAVTESGRIFSASSDEFIIREYSPRGEATGGFYYPVKKVSLTRNEAFISANDMTRGIAEGLDLPEYWPVMKSMWTDDKDRLWISTFTEADDELIWWIVEPDGELTARFRWPGDRHAYPLISGRTFKHIRGNYFYTREDDEETGLQTVVRYRIEVDTR